MDNAATWSTLSVDHHGVMSWHRLAKLGGQRSGPSHQPSASLAFCVLWAEGATRCRWYLGLRDRQALGCHADLRVGAASSVLVVPCSAAAGRHGRSGLGAAPRRHPGAAGRRATAARRVAKFSPSLRFLSQSTSGTYPELRHRLDSMHPTSGNVDSRKFGVAPPRGGRILM